MDDRDLGGRVELLTAGDEGQAWRTWLSDTTPRWSGDGGSFYTVR
jgi:hypothetical protein